MCYLIRQVTYLLIEVAGNDGVHQYQIPVPDHRTDDQVVVDLVNFDPQRY